MKFWDTSAIVPLLLEEENSQECRNLYRADPAVVVWQFTETEVVSAVMKASRSAPPLLEAEELDRAHARLDRLANRWEQVMVLTEGGLVEIRRRARRLMREHTMRQVVASRLDLSGLKRPSAASPPTPRARPSGCAR